MEQTPTAVDTAAREAKLVSRELRQAVRRAIARNHRQQQAAALIRQIDRLIDRQQAVLDRLPDD